MDKKSKRGNTLEEFYFDKLNDTQKEILGVILKKYKNTIQFNDDGGITISVPTIFLDKYEKENIYKVWDILYEYYKEKVFQKLDDIVLYGNPIHTTKLYKTTTLGLYDMIANAMEEKEEKYKYKEIKLEFFEIKTRLPLFVRRLINNDNKRTIRSYCKQS